MDRPEPTRPVSLGVLSPRELEALAMTARGLTNAQIAQHMGVTVHAVKFHLGSIYRKLRIANRTEAAALYFRTLAADAPAKAAG